jgi:hypothetical protein
MVLTIKEETVPPWDYRGALSPGTGPDLPGLARRRALLGACSPLIGPRGKPGDYHLYLPLYKMPSPEIFSKNHSTGFCPRKTPAERTRPGWTPTKNF